MSYTGYDFSTGKGILDYALDRANEVNDEASDSQYLQVTETDIQTAYIGVLSSTVAPWARKYPPGVIITVPEITTGSVQLTTGSAAGVFSVAPADSMAGRKIYADNDQVVCRILTHNAGATAFTLDAEYPETGGTACAFHVFQDEYAVATDFLAPRNTKKFLKDCGGAYDIDLVSEQELEGWFAFPPMQSGTTPRVCAFIADKTLRVAPWPREARRWEYEYNYHPGTLAFTGAVSDDVSIIQPAEDGVVVALMAIANLLLNKNDDRAATFAQAAAQKLSAINGLAQQFRSPRLWVRSQFSVSGRR